ncbi:MULTISPECIES: GntR family transcriptional regulator [unclassified Cryobacterium]|uniref:GntR family transcriptional regulator n=1 Tax=unclassified Cryobacterium TaxID=2649013 RepID=UPI000CE4F02A|nr:MULTISPECIES: GntR family transcriptional regulator [unclassified Cryobacterium]TFB60332.1 GntR family transcriptional regulator [Cryobacterium sp. Sr3]TFC68555.1 GntR family transcriptional regulator [Cryobacterium sp. TMT2-4]
MTASVSTGSTGSTGSAGSTGVATGSTTGVSTTGAEASLSKAQLAHRWIRARISDGSFSPGYRLVLGQIAREIGVSTVPVREAIRLLEAEGLVTFERNVGAQVAMLDVTEYTHTMQTLALVEGYATALSAPRLDPETLLRAREINAEMDECLHHFDPVRFTSLNREFHSALFEACSNAHILDLVQRGWSRLGTLRESTFSFVPGRAHESVAEHTALLDLIKDGADPLQIELAARDHRLGTLNAFLAQQHTAPTASTP